MHKRNGLSALGYTLFSVVLGVWGLLLSPENMTAFSLIGLYILLPLAAMASAVPMGFRACGGRVAALYTVYTALVSQAVCWTVFCSMDAESLVITGALTIIGVGIGDYLKNKRNARRKRKNI